MTVTAAPSSLVELDPWVDRRWERFVAERPDALVYHHPLWLEVLRRTYGYECVGLACERAGRVCGVLPLFRTHGLLTGRSLSSLPHTPVAGPLAVDGNATACLLRAAIERVRADGRSRLRIKSTAHGLSELSAELAEASWEPTYVMELPSDPGALRFGNSRNHARIKWAVNKAAKAGVNVREAETMAELRAWYRLYLETMRSNAVLPRPYRFFVALWDVLRPRGYMRLLLAEQSHAASRTLLAGSLFLAFGEATLYAFTGAAKEHLTLRPNDVIQWRAIHDASAAGFNRYDFGEVGVDDHGLADFKRKWGGEPRPLHRYYYPAPRELESGVLDRSSRARRLANGVWKRMPLPATAVVGDWLYRRL
jgi:CelD/BcsL family acetyltransferase involved in cellulose biosynthesis